MKYFLTILALAFLLFWTISCRKDDQPCLTCPPPYLQHIFIDTLIVDPTEVWLHVYTNDSTVIGQIQLYRDTLQINHSAFQVHDTIIVDTGMAPNSIHSYRLYRITGSTRQDSSVLSSITMIDTTSHNFTWQIDTLGDGASSELKDVFIINDTCVWAVGEISFRDSSGNFISPPSNYAVWNGSQWKLNTSYEPGYLYGSLYAVFAFSANDIWVGSTIPEHWDGRKWTFYGVARGFPTGFYISRIWGTSSTNLFVVGTGGSIVHFDGLAWTTLASGTTLPIQDLWSTLDKRGNSEIIAIASDKYFNQGMQVLEIQGSTVRPYPDSGLIWTLSGVWFQHKEIKYVVGGGMFKQTALGPGGGWVEFDQGVTTYYTQAIRGQASNDIAVVGDYGVVLHYNGMSWRNYQSETYLTNGSFYAVTLKRNLLVAVGQIGDRAVTLIGRR
jgi:hypothetical protein